MADYDHWKKAYKHLWGASGSRETAVAELIGSLTGVSVERVGFGAGSTEFIHGQAEKHGYEKGAADLAVVGTNIRLEVTGPLSKAVSPASPLWVRPDKIENARRHLGEHDTWVVHCLEQSGVVRSIRLDAQFFHMYDSGRYETVSRVIRGNEETMVEIPSDDQAVKPLSVLVDVIKKAKK